MAQTLQEILAGLAPQYAPQEQLLATQQAALPGQQAAEQAGLDTAKTNAFTDITRGANARGMLYSGTPLNEQNTYVGERYLPAVANLKNGYADQGFKLTNALAELNKEKYGTATNTRNAQLKAEYDYALEQQKMAQQAALARQKAAADNAMWSGMFANKAAAAAPQKTVSDHLGEDISALLNNYKDKYLPGYTERTVIPKLTKLYPEFNPDQIKNAVYTFRKATYGE